MIRSTYWYIYHVTESSTRIFDRTIDLQMYGVPTEGLIRCDRSTST